MNKTNVSIRFTSLTNLWAFRREIDINLFEMNLSKLMITCECSEEEIQLAIEKYNGKLIDAKKENA
jgi:hypothetical protein